MNVESIRDKLINLSDNQPYVIIPCYLSVQAALLDTFQLIKESPTKATSLFQQEDLNDKKRRQVIGDMGVRKVAEFSLSVGRLMTQMCHKLKQSEIMILVSLPGSVEQRTHCDFNPNERNKEKTKQSYFVFLSVMPNTKLIGVIDQKKAVINLSMGDLLIGRGCDFIHAGAGYEDVNIRFHRYFDYPGNGRQLHRT